jgi:hypothetical protein
MSDLTCTLVEIKEHNGFLHTARPKLRLTPGKPSDKCNATGFAMEVETSPSSDLLWRLPVSIAKAPFPVDPGRLKYPLAASDNPFTVSQAFSD